MNIRSYLVIILLDLTCDHEKDFFCFYQLSYVVTEFLLLLIVIPLAKLVKIFKERY